MPPVTVFRAGPEHRLLARQAVKEVHGRGSFDEESLGAFLSDQSSYLLLAVEAGTVVGSLNGYALRHPQRKERQFLLYEIDVREGWRRQGIGKELVTTFVDTARRARAFEVWVPTNASNAAAMALYRACGLTQRNPDDVLFSLAL